MLHPGAAPCTLLIDGSFVTESADTFDIADVSRIATAAAGACAEGVLYDVNEERKAQRSADDHVDPMPLEAGHIFKPEHSRPADGSYGDGLCWESGFADMNFDGYADLCVVEARGTWGYGQRCWLFDPHERAFVREKALEPLICMTLDSRTRTISSAGRIGFCEYLSTEHAWYGGHLVEAKEEITNCERPDGKPMPEGSKWVVRRARRAGRLVTTFAGLVKSPPP